jgi:hypothetical protein
MPSPAQLCGTDRLDRSTSGAHVTGDDSSALRMVINRDATDMTSIINQRLGL